MAQEALSDQMAAPYLNKELLDPKVVRMENTKSPSGSFVIMESSPAPTSIPGYQPNWPTCLGYSTIKWLLTYILKHGTPPQRVYTAT